MEDSVVITGGWASQAEGTQIRGRSRVQVYDRNGEVAQLPDLQQARYMHACGHFVDNQNNIVKKSYDS